jgi:outer membrane protein OmpA-like peptidoglycan-associated protein
MPGRQLPCACALGLLLGAVAGANPARGNPAPQHAAVTPLIVEAQDAAPLWTAQAQAALTLLQRAARGSGIEVQREGHRIRLAAWNEAAFAPNSAELALPLRALLDEWADGPGAIQWRVVVNGHTAGGGQAQANQQLARQRALAVQRHLLLRGVVSVTVGASPPPQGPAATATTAAGQRPANRGVQLWLEASRD